MDIKTDKMNKLIEAIRTTDFKKLSEQKLTLVKLAGSPLLEQEVKEDIEGIISLLDAIQDFTVADGIQPESVVFPPRDKNGKIIDLGDSVEVDEDANDLINNSFVGTVEKIKDSSSDLDDDRAGVTVVVVDQEENYYEVDCPSDYLTLE